MDYDLQFEPAIRAEASVSLVVAGLKSADCVDKFC